MVGSRGRDSRSYRLDLRTQLWPLPTAGLIASVALGLWLPRVDAAVDSGIGETMSAYLFSGGPSAARSVLSSIASSLITVTSLTFSLTVVTLQLASSQYSPRLLRTFARDRLVHVTLAVLLAGFTYSLTVLRTIRESADGSADFVPQISVTVAFVLAIAGVLALVLFLAHLAREIRVETMLDAVHDEAVATSRRLMGEHDPQSGSVTVPTEGVAHLCIASSGFVVGYAQRSLIAAAADADAVILVHAAVGAAVVAGTPVAAAWPAAGGCFDPETLDRLRRRVAPTIRTGVERTEAQDVGFGLRQLVDVVTKALSPGINDPTTAVHALGHISALLCHIARQDPQPLVLSDDDRVRVVLARPTFAVLLDSAMTQPCVYGAADPLVLERLFQLLREVAWIVSTPDQRDAVARNLQRLRSVMDRQRLDSSDEQRLRQCGVLVELALSGIWEINPPLSRS